MQEADGGGTEAGNMGQGLPTNPVPGEKLHEPWYQREARKDTAQPEKICSNGCLGAELVHHCETCSQDLCEACGTLHAINPSTKLHVLTCFKEKKVFRARTQAHAVFHFFFLARTQAHAARADFGVDHHIAHR